MDRPRINSGCLPSLLLWLLIVIGCVPPSPVWPIPAPINPPVWPIPAPINPPVPVNPVAGNVFLIVIEETGERTPETANVLNGSSDWWHALGKRGISYRWCDDDSPGVERIVAAVKERPGYLVMDSHGKNLSSGRLPQTTAKIDAMLKGFGK